MDNLDRLIADAAREGAADSFGPYFAERTVKRARQPSPRPTRRWTGLLRPALAAAAVVMLILVADWNRVRVVTAESGTEVVSLPDGSRVTLARGSALSHRPFILRGRRQVSLEGQAFFDVASDPDRPFSVETFNARVVVTGTRFNVRAWPGALEPETAVALEEGGVLVEPLSGEPLALTPGRSARVADGAARPDERASVEAATSWRDGGIALVDIPLGDALSALEQRFGVNLETEANLARRPVSYVAPSAESVEDVLDAICFALGLTYRPVLGGFVIESGQ